jgi:protein SCO1
MASINKTAALTLCVLLLPWAIGALAPGNPAPLPALERVTVLAAPKEIPDFKLTDQDGRPRTMSSMRGNALLIFFGFTHCPDVCPATMTKLKLLHASGGGQLQAVRVIMISVDGERDTPAVIKKYLASFSPEFIGLTGDPRAVGNIAAQFSAVAFKEQPDQAGAYGYFHSSQVFLVDKSGRLRASFSDASVENMATVTRLVQSESSNGARS